MGKAGVLKNRTDDAGIEDNKIQAVFHVIRVAVVNFPALADGQIPGMGRKGPVGDIQPAGAGADIDQLDLFVPVGQKADILIAGMPYHEIRVIAADLVKRFYHCGNPQKIYCFLKKL